MGMRRNAEIEAWQKKSGLTPSDQQELLGRMSNAAFELIKVIELERSGVRDGDGYWSGSDVVGGTANDLTGLIDEYLRRTRKTPEPRPANGHSTQQGDVPTWAR